MAGLCVGIFLMAVAAGRLSETTGNYLAYFGGAVAVSLLVKAIVVWRHNDRLPPQIGRDPLPGRAPDLLED